MNYTLYKGDCLEKMKEIKDNSVDMILCDLPYGTTSCKWDKVIDFTKLWEQYNRIIKGYGAIVLFGAEPFSTKLRSSNLKMFKYDWIWVKNAAVGFVNAKLKPMNKHEVISVFSKGTNANGQQCKKNMPYYPQGLKPCNKKMNAKTYNADSCIRIHTQKKKENTYWRPSHCHTQHEGFIQQWTNYPDTVLYFAKPSTSVSVHPTQKPVELLEYLIKTYTKENETVLDNCMGSGSTGVACQNTNRNFIGIELTDKYFEIAENRMKENEDRINKEFENCLFTKEELIGA